MHHLKKIATFAILLSLAFTGTAFALEYFSDPYDAATLDARAERTRARYENQGYTLVSENFQQYYYFAEPQTPYVYGTYTFTYSKPCEPAGPAEMCLGTDIAEVIVEVSVADQGFFVSKVTTNEYTVY